MSVTFEVSQPASPSTDVREEQPENALSMSVTFEVSQPERLRDVREVQPENIP